MKVCSLRKLTLSAAAALVAISLSPGSAQATCAPGTPAGTCRVTVRGSVYDVTTIFTDGKWDNVSKFAPPPAPGAMPWWGDSVLAGEFATAVGKGLNATPPGMVELTPSFAYEYVKNDASCPYPYRGEDLAGTLLKVTYFNGQLSSGGGTGWPTIKCRWVPYEEGISGFWAQATPVPGP